MARKCSHKKTAIFGWLAFIAVAFLIGTPSALTSSTRTDGHRRAGHVDSLLRDEFKELG